MTWEELVFKFKKEKLLVTCLSLEQRHVITRIIADHEPESSLRFVEDDYPCSRWPYIGFGETHWALFNGEHPLTISYEDFCGMWFGNNSQELRTAGLEDIL